jgi:hypothetical protein
MTAPGHLERGRRIRSSIHFRFAAKSGRKFKPMLPVAECQHLEEALSLADEIEDGQTGFLIERALDEARSLNLGQPAIEPPTKSPRGP